MAEKKSKKNPQLNFRIEKETLDLVEEYAKEEKIDKLEWIRRCIRTEVSSQWILRNPYEHMVNQYVYGGIREDEFEDYLRDGGVEEIPDDILQRRKDWLEEQKKRHSRMLSKKKKGGTAKK